MKRRTIQPQPLRRNLSTHQKEIVNAMRAGYKFYKTPKFDYIVGNIKSNMGTFYILYKAGIISEGSSTKQNGQEYVLTDLGKTMDI